MIIIIMIIMIMIMIIIIIIIVIIITRTRTTTTTRTMTMMIMMMMRMIMMMMIMMIMRMITMITMMPTTTTTTTTITITIMMITETVKTIFICPHNIKNDNDHHHCLKPHGYSFMQNTSVVINFWEVFFCRSAIYNHVVSDYKVHSAFEIYVIKRCHIEVIMRYHRLDSIYCGPILHGIIQLVDDKERMLIKH